MGDEYDDIDDLFNTIDDTESGPSYLSASSSFHRQSEASDQHVPRAEKVDGGERTSEARPSAVIVVAACDVEVIGAAASSGGAEPRGSITVSNAIGVPDGPDADDIIKGATFCSSDAQDDDRPPSYAESSHHPAATPSPPSSSSAANACPTDPILARQFRQLQQRRSQPALFPPRPPPLAQPHTQSSAGTEGDMGVDEKLSAAHAPLQMAECAQVQRKYEGASNKGTERLRQQEECRRLHTAEAAAEKAAGVALAERYVQHYRGVIKPSLEAEAAAAAESAAEAAEAAANGAHRHSTGSTERHSSASARILSLQSKHRGMMQRLRAKFRRDKAKSRAGSSSSATSAGPPPSYSFIMRDHLAAYSAQRTVAAQSNAVLMEFPWLAVEQSVDATCGPFLALAQELQDHATHLELAAMMQQHGVDDSDNDGGRGKRTDPRIAALAQTTSPEEQLTLCRAYLTGFLEVACGGVPRHLLTAQGAVYYTHAGGMGAVALGRHPFRRAFLSAWVCVHELLPAVRNEDVPYDALVAAITDFVDAAADVWLKDLQHFFDHSLNSGGSLAEEVLLEALQHVFFSSLSMDQVARTLKGHDSSGALSLPGHVRFNYDCWVAAVGIARRGGSEQAVMSALYDLHGVPDKHRPFDIRTDNFEILQQQAESSPAESAGCTTEASTVKIIAEDPYYRVACEVAVLRLCRTPLEVVTVLQATVGKLTGAVAAVQASSSPSSSSSSAQPALAADDILPLLSLSMHFAVILGHNERYRGSAGNFPMDVDGLYALVKAAELFLPEHLSIRQDAYVLTVAATALHSMVY